MNEPLITTATNVADELIAISEQLSGKMVSWRSMDARPDGLSATECVGFVNGETDGLTLVIDIQVPDDGQQATLRTWGIESHPDVAHVERFNSIQLDFLVGYAKAQELASVGEVTRGDIRTLLHDQSTQLSRVLVSNQSGFDSAKDELLGERYDHTIEELAGDPSKSEVVTTSLTSVISLLKQSAAAEVEQMSNEE